MIKKETIQAIVDEKLQDTNIYPVVIKVSQTNKITIFLDSEEAVTIEDCVNVSRFIESKLDRDIEDFELEVSSYGLSQPMIDKRQFKKRVGKLISVLNNENQKFKGILKSVEGDIITLELELTNKQKKEGLERIITFNFSEIKEAKPVISFK